MPDSRRHRGAHPDDPRLFAEARLPAMRTAVEELSWLLTRGYAWTSALQCVGNRHVLTERQRIAVRRCACSDQSQALRRSTCVDKPNLRVAWASSSLPVAATSGLLHVDQSTPVPVRRLTIDGYNLLITVESALSGGLVLVGRDGCCRDLASIHGTYRKVEETLPALRLIADYLQALGVREVRWLLDRPVSNSGRLRGLMEEHLSGGEIAWTIELVDNPDKVLCEDDGVIVTSDSDVLDKGRTWTNLTAGLIAARVPQAWIVDLRANI